MQCYNDIRRTKHMLTALNFLFSRKKPQDEKSNTLVNFINEYSQRDNANDWLLLLHLARLRD